MLKKKKIPLCLPLIIHKAMHTAVKLITILGELSQIKLKCELLYTSLAQCYRLNIKRELTCTPTNLNLHNGKILEASRTNIGF